MAEVGEPTRRIIAVPDEAPAPVESPEAPAERPAEAPLEAPAVPAREETGAPA